MTMHDDSNIQLLERDLRKLVEPRAEDERARLVLRRQLAARLQPRPRRRPSVRIALGSSALSAAAAVIAIAVLVATNGSAGTTIADAAIIHHALKAVTPPPNEILHMKLVGVENGLPIAGETWLQTSAPYASRTLKGEVGHQGEFADNGRTSFEYDPRTNTIRGQPGAPSQKFTDPTWQVRQELAGGQAQVAGTVVIDGASLYKIDLPHGLVGYFDMTDYRPRYLDDPQRDGTVVRLRFSAYEYLPMTQSNRALLSITAQHPGARVEMNPPAVPSS